MVQSSHIRGWLLLFCLHAVLMGGANAYVALHGWTRVLMFMPLYVTSATARSFAPYIAGRAAFQTMFVVLLAAGLYLTLCRDTRARRYWHFALPSAILCQGAVLFLTSIERSALAALQPPVHPLPLAPIVRLVILFSSIGLWWIYWERSRRVQELFPGPRPLPAAA